MLLIIFLRSLNILFFICQVNRSSHVKFYCDIRLAFVEKDHQLVSRYNIENKKNKKTKTKKKCMFN